MDAWHISTHVQKDTVGIKAMRKALEGAGLHSSDIDYLNLHGTSTPQNDF